MKRQISLFLFCLSIILTACNPPPSHEAEDTELTIYTSIYPIQYITKEIAGDIASVTSVYPPGVDAHTYEPTSKMVTSIANSDAFIYLGAGMEGFAETTAEAIESHDVAIVEIGKQRDLFHIKDGNNHKDEDPHIWLDPIRMIDMAEIIKTKLIQMIPDHEEAYIKNFNQFKDNMIQLDQTFLDTLQEKNDKHILVSHAAYGYWEERYGIEQIPISGLSSSSEPSQKELASIVNIAKRKNIKYVIYEQNASDRISTIIQDHIQAKALYIHNLEVLTEEDLDNKEDYLSLMERNLHVLDQALE